MRLSGKILMGISGLLLALLFLCASCDCSDPFMGNSTGAGSGDTGEGNDSMSSDESVCGDPKTLLGWPTSGYFLEYNYAHEVFLVWVANDTNGSLSLISNWVANGFSDDLGQPGAPIVLDNTFNPGYSYSLKPESVVFKPAGSDGNWPETCDAAPCYVEDDRFAWIKDPIVWCPWNATVQKVWDCSGNAAGDQTCGDPIYEDN